MTALFADTFYWIALADFKDRAHRWALAITAERLRRGVAASVQRIMANPVIRVIPQSRDLFIAGLQLYTQRPDKRYSLTDCISIETMRRERLTVALTYDRHFEREGFRALFRES